MKEDREPTGDAPIEPDQSAAKPAPAKAETPDPADQVPVPAAMSAAEIDERAQVVEKLRHESGMSDPDPDPKSQP